jgi:hypothetical protein
MLPEPKAGMALFTHSIPSVLFCAAIAGLFHAAIRQPGARYITLAWLLHWPADLLTGRKPMLGGTALVGLDLYSLPAVDFVLETAVVATACVIYARRFAPRAELRRVVVILGMSLVLLQGFVDVTLAVIRNSEWTPSLASSSRPAQVTAPASGPGG